MLSACGGGGGGGGSTPTYTVTYHANEADNGSVPVDGNSYVQGNTVTVLSNTGGLERSGYVFAGWCVNANGTGDSYTPGETFTMGSANITLYAKWTPTYTVTYHANEADSGDVPVDSTSYEQGDEVTVLGNTGSLVRSGHAFAGWCVNANGTGDSYTPGETFTIGSADVTLYAKWTPTYTVTYNGNESDSGDVPVDSTSYEQGDEVTVLGNTGSLVRDGYTFAGWCVNIDGTGDSYTQGQTFVMGSTDVVLYAIWSSTTTGIPDTDFDSDGIVTTSVGASSSIIQALAIQDDRKIVAAGYSVSLVDGTDDFCLVRYNPDGSQDTTFDTDGIVTTPVSVATDDRAYALGIQDDGKIVAAGYSVSLIDGTDDFCLVRYNTDGTLDTTFGTDGIVTTPVGSGTEDIASALAIQSDGKIVAAGRSLVLPTWYSALVRYNTDGTLDTTFGTDGIVTTQEVLPSSRFHALCMQIVGEDEKIVAAGYAFIDGSNDFSLVRYDIDGSLDLTFDTDGIVTTPVGTDNDRANALYVQGDGKIVAAGYSLIDGTYDFSLVRYDMNGLPDPTFGTGGIVTTSVVSGNDSSAYALSIQGDGKIVAAGYSFNGADNDFALIRYNPDGSLDTDFDMDGKVVTPVGTDTEDFAYALSIQDDGGIMAAGTSNNNFALVRYR